MEESNFYPVFKSIDPCLRTNYRPISVLSVIVKVFETIVHQQVTSYVTVYAKTVPIGTTIEIHFMA